MARVRSPWWMYVIALTLLAYTALVNYCVFFGPEPLGMDFEVTSGGLLVRGVDPHSAARQAGLQPGDRVVTVDNEPIRGMAGWSAVHSNMQIGRPLSFDVERDGQRLELSATPVQVSRSRQDPLHLIHRLTVAVGQGVTLILALIILFLRPNDLTACVGAAFLSAVGTVYFESPPGFAATVRELPALFELLHWIPFTGSLAIAPLLLSFFAIFPRPLFDSRRAWTLIWSSWLFAAAPVLLFHFRTIHGPGVLTAFEPDVPLALFGLASIAYVLGGFAALALNYRRLLEANERRRVRVLLTGTVVGLLAMLPFGLVTTTGSTSGLVVRMVRSWHFRALATGIFLVFPGSFAYAILKHRLFDIRLMIRQGLRYAFARGVVAALIPALAALLLGDLWVHRDRPLAEVLRSRGWLYMAVGALALAAGAWRKRWLEGLDRHFFRERYDARRLLREVVEEIRKSGSLGAVAPVVVERIEAALHPEFASILVREPQGTEYRSIASSPAGHVIAPLSAGNKLVSLLRLLGKPVQLDLGQKGWLQQQLPQEESDFLRRSRIGLLIPIAASLAETEILLILGHKRSEEPFGGEDLDLLVTIASGLALLLEKAAAPGGAEGMTTVTAPPGAAEVFKECPRCGACYDADTGRCPNDAGPLVITPASRRLAGRYRLDRRLGRGGMGTVYEASDAALDRRVAVKLIRDDLLGNPEAADRFRREARIAANFVHPNVVTVHDFGVEVGDRAFLVMELLEGRTLREELRSGNRVTAQRTMEILRRIGAALDAAHRQQLIHRDLKPENVFLLSSESREPVKVLDFGLAKFLPTVSGFHTFETDRGVLVGTPRYMAPERLRGEDVSPSWDLWALAIMAYEMVTGAHPFGQVTESGWRTAVLAGRFTPVAAHVPGAPARCQEFFEHALAPDPQKRPAPAHGLLAALELALSNGP